jgi:hypothetical protein
MLYNIYMLYNMVLYNMCYITARILVSDMLLFIHIITHNTCLMVPA